MALNNINHNQNIKSITNKEQTNSSNNIGNYSYLLKQDCANDYFELKKEYENDYQTAEKKSCKRSSKSAETKKKIKKISKD